MANPGLSIVIPAHDEETTIGATLRHLLADADETFEVIVAANGCTDRTAEVARAVSPRVTVVEVATPSKIAALNAADAVATAFPRAYVDADVRVDAATLRALAAALADDRLPRVASPRFQLDTSASSWPAQQYFRVWLLNDYNSRGHIGSGIYALSAAGRARFGAFPEVIADDRFVQQLFPENERIVLTEHDFSVPAPRTLSAQIRRSVRIHAGNAQLRDQGIAGEDSGGQFTALARRTLPHPGLWPAFAVYCYGYAAARLQARRLKRSGDAIGWRRDDTTRVTAD